MGGAGGSSTKQKSNTQSFNFSDIASLQEAWNQSQAQNTSSAVNQGTSQNASDSFSNQDSASRSFVDANQQPFLQNLWQQGMSQANPGQAVQASNQMVGQAMPGMQAAMKSATALTNPASQIKAQAGSLQAGLGQMFRQEMMPAIKSNAIASGGFGGGRQGIAEARGVGQLADAYTKGYGDIVAGANATALGAGELAGSLGGQMYNLGMMPSMAGFAPLQAMSGLLGSPTVLQEALSRGRGASTATGSSQQTGSSTARGTSTSSGGSKGTSTSHSEGRMKSKSSNKAWQTEFNILR
jgi:hypothetical protein